MARVFLSGDKHGFVDTEQDYDKILKFCQDFNTTRDDFMVILGDHGVNFFGPKKKTIKRYLSTIPISFILLRGNHDRRVNEDNKTKLIDLDKDNVKGKFFVEEQFPSIYYPMEYGWYELNHRNVFIICGAYSHDKAYRLEQQFLGFKNWLWFHDEQLTAKQRAEAYTMYTVDVRLGRKQKPIIMSHECPAMFQYYPDKDSQDLMSPWLNEFVDVGFDKWYCGHHHEDKNLYKLRFMYHDIIQLEQEK